MKQASKLRRPPAHAKTPTPADPASAPIDAASLDEAFVKALATDFLRHGMTAIEAMRAEKPTDYVKLVAAVRPKTPNDAAHLLREMSDVELDREIGELAREAGYEMRPAESPRRAEAAPHDDADAD